MGTFDDMGEEQDRERRRRGHLRPWEVGRYDSNGDPIQAWQRKNMPPPHIDSRRNHPAANATPTPPTARPRSPSGSSSEGGCLEALVSVIFLIILIGVIAKACGG